MAKYSKLRKALEEQTKSEIEDMKTRLSSMTCGEAKSSWYHRQLMTDVAARLISAANANDEIPVVAQQKMLTRFIRGERKLLNSMLNKLSDAEDVELPISFCIEIEWKRGSYGTMNPTATVNAVSYSEKRDERGILVAKHDGQSTTGRAGGSGYDKESAAAASAMNQNKFVMKILYERAEVGGDFEYGVTASRSVLPHCSGGVGMTSLVSVFEKLGYKCSQHHGKYFDTYDFKRGEA